jgi:hypothetical protein
MRPLAGRRKKRDLHLEGGAAVGQRNWQRHFWAPITFYRIAVQHLRWRAIETAPARVGRNRVPATFGVHIPPGAEDHAPQTSIDSGQLMYNGVYCCTVDRSDPARRGRRRPQRVPVTGSSGFKSRPALGGACLQRPMQPPLRVAMALPVINHARHVVVAAAAAGRTGIISEAPNWRTCPSIIDRQ